MTIIDALVTAGEKAAIRVADVALAPTISSWYPAHTKARQQAGVAQRLQEQVCAVYLPKGATAPAGA